MTPTCAAIIVGIEGFEKFTLPLVESIRKHEPDCYVVVIDNASSTEYPAPTEACDFVLSRTHQRLCYSAAINRGKDVADNAFGRGPFDWYIVLSNDVLCTGPFAHTLEAYGDGDLVGPCLKQTHGFDYLEGWCVAVSKRAWDAVGGFDERFLGSDWEDVAFSHSARQRGFGLVEDLPFIHLDQRQRYTIIEDFWGKDAHNRELFMREYAGVKA